MVSGMSGTVAAADKDIVDKGAQPIAYDISPVNDGTNIAIGKNAKVFIGGGTQESMLSFGEKAERTYTEKWGFKIPTGWNIHSNEHAKKNLPEAIAIGTNSYARTGSIEIGAHTLAENKISIGDTTADQLRQFGVASTTLGTNSYTGGGFATTISSYNVQTNQYEAAGLSDTGNATKNAFATVIGTFNSNESLSSYDSTSGVANMISGTANKVTNSNGAIVMGAGNSVKDSIASFDTSAYSSLFKSAADMQKALMKGVASSAGGATLVIGGANSAEKTQNSQIMGVGNSMKSTSDEKVQYNYLDGFNSSITDASHVKVLGQSVIISKGADSNTVIGDYRTVAEGQTHNVIIGNADEKAPITTEKKDTVIVGHNANATVDGGGAIGAGSVASREAGVAGYDPATKTDSTDSSATWKATDAAVSVGKADGTMTRQITGVAAGTEATDAVNVAQLQKALSGARDGNDTLKSNTNALKLEGNTLSMNVEDTAGHKVSGSVDLSKFAQAVDTNTTYTLTSEANPDNDTTTITLNDNNGNKNSVTVATKDTDTRNTVKAGENVTLDTRDNADGSHEYTVHVKADGKVEAGSTKIVSGGTVYNETRVAQDGTYVKASNTAGENLSALDKQVASNTGAIRGLNGRVSNLDSRLNKVGAGAAALAALHPQDFNPDDKWDFAVGFGNYRDANAMALGAFYRPDDRTMFSVAGNFGNGENMVNAGISVKLGKNSPYAGMNRQAMIHRLASQDRELEAQNQRIAKLEQLVAQLMAK
ncbi:YadA-like family protein [Acidaminococcus timonensis]|uniref:YadA-like family protein n=1 Tax=Acidaminococcus timonensis TaxID=1871002 RepID=UPI0029422E56|nr:YadA-like family protein [Acidaminococcus timonensis]